MTKDKKPKLTPSFLMLEEALKIWWKNLKKIIGIYLWGFAFALIPLTAVFLFLGLNAWLGDSLNNIVRIIFFIIGLLGILVAIYFSLRAYMGVFVLVRQNYEGRELAIFKSTKKLFWPYFVLTLLLAALTILWSLLLIIPGIIFGIFYSLACYVFFFEDKKGMAAIRRSQELIKHYWWPVFGRLLLIGVASWVFMSCVSVPLSLLPADGLFFQIWNAIVQVISFLIGPIAIFYAYQIYQDLLKIKQ